MPVTTPRMLAAESKDGANPVVHAEGKEENDTVQPSPPQPSGGFSKTVEAASILLEAEAQARRSEGSVWVAGRPGEHDKGFYFDEPELQAAFDPERICIPFNRGLLHGVKQPTGPITTSSGGGSDDEASIGCRRGEGCPYIHVPLLGCSGAENALGRLCAEVPIPRDELAASSSATPIHLAPHPTIEIPSTPGFSPLGSSASPATTNAASSTGGSCRGGRQAARGRSAFYDDDSEEEEADALFGIRDSNVLFPGDDDEGGADAKIELNNINNTNKATRGGVGAGSSCNTSSAAIATTETSTGSAGSSVSSLSSPSSLGSASFTSAATITSSSCAGSSIDTLLAAAITKGARRHNNSTSSSTSSTSSSTSKAAAPRHRRTGVIRGQLLREQMPLDPATGLRVCFYYNALPTGCQLPSCRYAHVYLDDATCLRLTAAAPDNKAAADAAKAKAEAEVEQQQQQQQQQQQAEQEAVKQPTAPPTTVCLAHTSSKDSRDCHGSAGRGKGYIKMPFDERGSGRRICYYYHFGGCTNEKDCPFSHAEVEISTLEYAYIRDADPLPRPNHARAGPRRPVAPPAQQQRHKDGSGSKDIGNNKAGPPPHPVGPRRSQRQGPPRRGARGGREQWKREQEQEQWNQQIEMLAMQVGGGTVVINEEAGGTPAVVDAQGVAWGYSPEGPVFLGPVAPGPGIMGGEPFPFTMDAAGGLYPAHPPHPAVFGPHPGDGGYYDPSTLPFGGLPPFPHHDGGEQPPAMEGELQEEHYHGPWPPAPMPAFGPYAGAPPMPPRGIAPHPLHRARSVDAIIPGNGKPQAAGGKGPSGVTPAGPVPALPLRRVASGNTLANANVGAGGVMGMGSPPPFVYGPPPPPATYAPVLASCMAAMGSAGTPDRPNNTRPRSSSTISSGGATPQRRGGRDGGLGTMEQDGSGGGNPPLAAAGLMYPPQGYYIYPHPHPGMMHPHDNGPMHPGPMHPQQHYM